MTNYEAIRVMNKNELAEFLTDIVHCTQCPVSEEVCDTQGTCTAAILVWLGKDSDEESVPACKDTGP